MELPDRISVYLSERDNGCWSWARAHSLGYACVWWEGQQRNLHRVLYLLFRGPLTRADYLDHIVCGDRSCPNPYHVEPTTNSANIHREVSERVAQRGTCPHGHDDWRVTKTGKRVCAECGRIDCRLRERRKHGIPEDWPLYKHFNHRREGGQGP